MVGSKPDALTRNLFLPGSYMSFLPAISSLLGLGLIALSQPSPCLAQSPAPQNGLPQLSLIQKTEDFEDAFEEVSTWQMHLTAKEGAAVDLKRRAAYPVGDGEVFGTLGLGRRANTLRGITGPGYATRAVPAQKGQFGELSLDVLADGESIKLESLHLWRLRGCNVVVSEDKARGRVSIRTVTFARPGSKTIYRWIEVQNLGDDARNLVLRVDWAGAVVTDQGRLQVVNAGEGRRAELSSSLTGKATPGQWLLDMGSIEAKKGKSLVLHLRMAEKNEGFAGPEAGEQDCIDALQGSMDSWSARLAGTTTLSSDRQDLMDLMEDWKVLMLVQRSAVSGAIVPMVGHRRSRITENNGPLLALLRYGLFKEAKQVLDYHVKAAIQSGRLEDDLAPGMDLSKVVLPTTPEEWTKIQVPNNEMAAWILLQHEWYYRATWDKKILTERWPFFVHLMESMKPDGRSSMPVSGKEPYMQDRWFRLARRTKELNFLPAESPARHSRSFDNSVLYLMGLNAMSEMGEDRDRQVEASDSGKKDWKSKNKNKYESAHLDFLQKMEESFWLNEENRFAPFLSPITGLPHRAPYAPVNLRLQWVGYTYALGEHNRDNLRNSLAELWQNRTRVGMTPTVGYTPGHLQGYLLYSLADMDDQNRGDCLDELLQLATSSAGWAEFYDPRGRPVDPDNSAYPARMGPFEAGINLDAIAFSLNGIRYAVSPGWSKKDQRFKLRLPTKSRWLSMKNLKHDGHQFHIFMDERFVKDVDIDKSGKPVRKMRFRLRYVVVNEDLGLEGSKFVDTAINVGEEVYVRYPSVEKEVNETGMWPTDKEKFLRETGGLGPYKGAAIEVPTDTTSLVITSTLGGSRPDGSYLIDIGLPYLPAQLAQAILAQPTVKTLLFDVGARELSNATQKGAAFWSDPSLKDAAVKFEAAGGKVITPTFIRTWGLSQALRDANKIAELILPQNFTKARNSVYKMEDARLLRLSLALPKSQGKTTILATSLIQSDQKRECTLRLGSSGAIRVWLNGKLVHENTEERVAQADQDEVLVKLQEGTNRLLIELRQTDEKGQLFARFTDLQSLPIPGLIYK